MQDPIVYASLKADHACSINYEGSSPGMETEGAKRIFERSISKNNLRYTKFFGDGDSKSHLTVKNLYDGVKVKKFECIEHVQKRVGNRLRNLKKNIKNIGGKGKLTLNIIDKLQNYYGIAIRTNPGNLKSMKKAVHAALFHVASSKEKNYYVHCPTGTDSWCGFQRDQTLGTNKYKDGKGLPLSVIGHYLLLAMSNQSLRN